jgi:hypothetical protein
LLNAELYLKVTRPLAKTERETCKDVIRRMVELANTARRLGMLSFEAEMEDEPSDFLKIGMGLVVDGTDPEVVEQLLLRLIFSEKTGMLSKLLMADGLLMIQHGFNPRVIRDCLNAALGEKAVLEMEGENPSSQKYHQFLDSLRSKKAPRECAEFDALLSRLDNRVAQRILQEVYIGTFVTALRGCGSVVIHKIINNLSLRNGMDIAERWAETDPAMETILIAQETVQNTIRALNDSGDIYVARL